MNSKRILLNSGWKFALNPVGDPLAKDFDASQLRPVELPHDWQIEAARDPDMPGGESQAFTRAKA